MAPMRKGPWTDQEDLQLVCFVGLFGDRRWDFIAQVSGLNRTGKSCRLRWVNYLHPGLKRGRMSPQEERLILELHTRWGNRWSQIARKLPGRTDNEIKNYWRTHMRKKAQERKKKALASSSSSPPSPSPSSSSSASSSLTDKYSTSSLSSSPSSSSSLPPPPHPPLVESGPPPEAAALGENANDEALKGYFMDQIISWDELAMPEAIGAGVGFEECKVATLMPSPMWEYCSPYSLWKIDDEHELEF